MAKPKVSKIDPKYFSSVRKAKYDYEYETKLLKRVAHTKAYKDLREELMRRKGLISKELSTNKKMKDKSGREVNPTSMRPFDVPAEAWQSMDSRLRDQHLPSYFNKFLNEACEMGLDLGPILKELEDKGISPIYEY